MYVFLSFIFLSFLSSVSWTILALVDWFYGMSTFAGLFNAKVIPLWLFSLLILYQLLGHVIFFEFLVSVIYHYHMNGLHLFWDSFKWFCFQISSDEKYFLLTCPRHCYQALIVVIMNNFQIWNKKEHNIIISRVISRNYSYIITIINDYHRMKWTRRTKFKSLRGLFGFHIAIIPLAKVWIQKFLYHSLYHFFFTYHIQTFFFFTHGTRTGFALSAGAVEYSDCISGVG